MFDECKIKHDSNQDSYQPQGVLNALHPQAFAHETSLQVAASG